MTKPTVSTPHVGISVSLHKWLLAGAISNKPRMLETTLYKYGK